MQNINNKQRIKLGLIKRALFMLPVLLKVRYLQCGKVYKYNFR